MWKYFFKKKFLFVTYFFVAVITYFVSIILYYFYSEVTKTAEFGTFQDANKLVIMFLFSIITLLTFILVLFYIKRSVLFVVMKSLRNDILTKIYSMKPNEFYSKNISYYKSIILNDLHILEENYYDKWVEVFSELIQLTIVLLAISFIGVNYLIVTLLFMIPIFLQPFIYKKKIEQESLTVSTNQNLYTKKVNDFFSVFNIAKIYSIDSLLSKKMDGNIEDLELSKYRLANYKAINNTALVFVVMLLKIGTQIYFTNNVINLTITVATGTMLFGLANNVGNPIATIFRYVSDIISTKEIRNKILNLIDNNSLEKSETEDKDFKISENIEIFLNNVTLSYGEKLVVDNFSYNFSHGKKYAIMGESGSGKSTIIKLIMGFFENYDGNIKINEFDQKNFSIEYFWQNISYVEQDVFIFSGTVLENITMFNNSYTNEEIDEATEISGLKILINNLENGIDTKIEEGGKNFSGGEKQRIGLARAILTKKKVILLDESFSALDNTNMFEIEKNILKLNRTIISITHRLNENIKYYDEILIIKNGKIASSGSYLELLEQKESSIKNLLEKERG